MLLFCANKITGFVGFDHLEKSIWPLFNYYFHSIIFKWFCFDFGLVVVNFWLTFIAHVASKCLKRKILSPRWEHILSFRLKVLKNGSHFIFKKIWHFIPNFSRAFFCSNINTFIACFFNYLSLCILLQSYEGIAWRAKRKCRKTYSPRSVYSLIIFHWFYIFISRHIYITGIYKFINILAGI